MQNLGGLFCPICLDYFMRPVTAICTHSFCEPCIQQYFLHFNTCPVCQQPIRRHTPHRATSLQNFIEHFIKNQHPEYLAQYNEKISKYQQQKQSRMLRNYHTGMLVDIRDTNTYIWRQGRIMRIISRIGQPCKFIKVELIDQQNLDKIDQQIKVNSDRLAIHGSYTSRDDIPKYRDYERKMEKQRDKNKEKEKDRLKEIIKERASQQ